MEEKENKIKIVYPQRELIKETLYLLNNGRADFARVTYDTVEQIIYAYEKTINQLLQKASEPNTEVIIHVFSGLKLIAEYVPARIVKMYGSIVKAKPKVACKARVSKYFKHFILNKNK